MPAYDISVYQNPLAGIAPYFVKHFYDASFDLNWHVETELLYLPAGSKPVTIEVDHAPVCMHERTLCIIAGGCLHSGLISEEIPHMLIVEFGIGLLGNDYLPFTEQRFVSPMLSFSDTDDPTLLSIERLLRQMLEAAPKKETDVIPYHTRLRLRANILQLVVKLVDAIPMKPANPHEQKRLHSTLAVQTAVQYISEHYDQPISLDMIAHISGYEKKQFGDLFKEATGNTFHQYLIRFRMEMACQMLRDTDMPINSIAAMVGIKHAKNFSRTFRKIYGLSAGNIAVRTAVKSVMRIQIYQQKGTNHENSILTQQHCTV